MGFTYRRLPGRKEVGVFALLLSAGVPVQAEEKSSFTLDETVVTATLSEMEVGKVPAAVEVITAREIAEMGAETLHQILAEAQSVTLEPTSGRQSTVRLRGLGSGSVLVLLDGVRLPSGFQDKVDLVEIPAGLIERIEIVRGPGSALYGSDAIGGVINVITKKPSGKPAAWFGSRYGQSRHGQAEETVFDAGASGTAGSLGYVVAGSFSDKGRFDFDASDMQTDGDDMHVASGAASLLWQAGERTTVSLGAIYAEVEREGLRAKNKRENDWNNGSDRFTGNVELRHELADDSSLLFRLSRSEYDWGLKLTPKDGSASEQHEVKQVSTQYDGRWRLGVAGGHIVTTGVEYRAEERVDDAVESDVQNFAVFVQDEISVTEKLQAIVGLRYDGHSGFGSVLSPRINLAWRLSERLRLRAAYGEGFRAPTAFELYSGSPYTINRVLLPNPELDPQTSKSWELGADYASGGFSLGLTAFRNDVRDMIAEVFTGTYEGVKPKIPVNRMENISDAMTQGFELSASWKLGGGFELSDEFTLLDSEDKGSGEELLHVPDISNVLQLAWRGKEAGMTAKLRLVTTTGTHAIGGGLKTAGYSMVNLYASKTLTSGVKLYGGVDNLFDKTVEGAYGNVYGPGRSGTLYYSGIGVTL